jgi:hypothetical protein
VSFYVKQLKLNIMKKVVLTLAAALVSAVTIAQAYTDLEIDTNAEKGSFDNPMIYYTDSESKPYVWYVTEKDNEQGKQKTMWGDHEWIDDYIKQLFDFYEVPQEIINNPDNSSTDELEQLYYWFVDSDGIFYTMYKMKIDEYSEIQLRKKNKEESIQNIKDWDFLVKEIYGKEKYKEWTKK